jgi:ribosome-binding protein aMBF1 (putative translation factor)
MDHQDWTPVIVTRPVTRSGIRAPAASGGRGPKIIAERDGAARNASAHAAKLEAADAPVKPKMLSTESRKLLTATRVALGKTQVQLNQQCAFPPNTIRELEAGHVHPTGAQLNKLNRELRIGLKLE